MNHCLRLSLAGLLSLGGMFLLGAMLGGCAAGATGSDLATFVVELKPNDHHSSRGEGPTLERHWVSTKVWEIGQSPAADQQRVLLIDLTTPGQQRSDRTYELLLAGRDVEHASFVDHRGQPIIAMAVHRPGATFSFSGSIVSPPEEAPAVHGGIVRVSFHEAFLSAARLAQDDPSMATLISAALRGVDANDLARFSELEMRPSIDQIAQLVEAGASPTNIQTLHEAGYRFSVDELVALTQGGVRIGQAVALREGGFRYSVTQLIALHEAQVDAGYAVAMKEAGFADDVQQLIRLSHAQVSPSFARQVRRLGVAHTDADLIRLAEHNIAPNDIATFQAAGYTLTADQLVSMSEAGVTAQDAAAYRQAGYNFSRQDLVRLAEWEVPVAFTLSLMADTFEPLAADQIVELYLRRVSPEMVRTLRQPREDARAAEE